MGKQKLYQKIHYVLYFFLHWLTSGGYFMLRKIKIENNIDTIRYIIDHKISVSRFGDGELALMTGHNTGFQKYNQEIANKLKYILISNQKNHIVCLPYPWKDLLRQNHEAFEYWSSWLLHNLKGVMQYLDLSKQYYDTNFTRFYIDYRNGENAKKVIPLIKEIWDDKDVYIVEGGYTRLGMGNDLLNNARSIHRIIAPSTNAFEKYDEIIAGVQKKCPPNSLILIALGMTATCLAFDLAKIGYWAIDIGHIDIEYEWFRMGAEKRVAVPGKYTAESKNDLLECESA